MAKDSLKLLKAAIADEMDLHRGTTRMLRAKRVLNVFNNHFEELCIEAFRIGRETDDVFELERQLKELGLLPKTCDINTRFEKILQRYE